MYSRRKTSRSSSLWLSVTTEIVFILGAVGILVAATVSGESDYRIIGPPVLAAFFILAESIYRLWENMDEWKSRKPRK